VSEWYDNQRKPSSDFRKLLQEKIDKANPRSAELTKDEEKRLGKLEEISARLRRGENVQNRQLQTWLTEDEYSQIEAEWQQQLELREELKDKPSELKRYEDKLKAASFHYNRAEGYSSKGKHTTAKKFYSKSESLCEDALEILQEIMHSNPYLQTWFDRDISFEVGEGLSADIVSLPRLVTSRSNERLRKDSCITRKLDVKLSILERAIEALKYESNESNIDGDASADRRKLSAFLKFE